MKILIFFGTLVLIVRLYYQGLRYDIEYLDSAGEAIDKTLYLLTTGEPFIDEGPRETLKEDALSSYE